MFAGSSCVAPTAMSADLSSGRKLRTLTEQHIGQHIAQG
jgi:hypothetical protein